MTAAAQPSVPEAASGTERAADPGRRRSPWPWGIGTAGVLALASAVRFHGLGRRSLWFDEGVSLGMVRLPLGEHLRHAFDHQLNNQLLYYLVLRPWHALGEGEATLRSLSAVLSVGAVALTAALGRRIFGAAAGLVAGAVLALNLLEVRYAQEARGYGLAVFLVVAAALFLDRFVEGGRRRDLAAWAVASALAVYAHFFSALAVAAQVAGLAALGVPALRRRKGVFLGLAALVAGTLPVAVYALRVPKDFMAWVPPVTLERVAWIATLYAGGTPWLLAVFAAFLAALAAGVRPRRPALERWRAALVLSWAVLPLALASLASIRQSILLERYVLMAVPAWALSAGAILGPRLAGSRRSIVGAAAALGVVVAGEAYTLAVHDGDPYEDWRRPASDVAAATRPGDAIVYESGWSGLAFGYYLARARSRPEPLQRGPLVLSGEVDLARAAAPERVWLVLSRPGPVEALDAVLRRSHPVVSGIDYGPVQVLLYDVRPRLPGAGAFGY